VVDIFRDNWVKYLGIPVAVGLNIAVISCGMGSSVISDVLR